MRRTLVIADENGQLGNKLYLFTHYASFVIDTGGVLFFPAFNSISEYFECVNKNDYHGFTISTRFSGINLIHSAGYFFLYYSTAIIYRILPVTFLYRIIRIYQRNDLRLKEFDFFILESEPEVSMKQKLMFLQGWSFRAPQAVLRQKKKVIPLLKLSPDWQEKLDVFMKEPREKYDLLIGVHVRRGDYKNYCDGKYFYDDETYLKFMHQTAALFPEKKIGFMICSNEKITITEENNFEIELGTGHFVLDMFALSRCDYIIGPPSTYSQFASFYGDKPLRILHDGEKPIESVGEFVVSGL